MELFALNEKFESIAVIDEFESLIWTDRYDRAGDFEIYVPMHPTLLQKFVKNYYLWSNESNHVMIIEQIEIVTDTETGNNLIVTGRSLESILDRRIVWKQTIVNGNLQNVIHQLLNDAIINPEIADRKIDNFIFQECTDERVTSLTIDTQFTGDNLYDILCAVCQKNNIGFRIILNESNQFVFSLYVGEDRSYDQTKNPYVIFSPGYENIISSNYLESNSGFKNVTLVAGEGEGADRITATVGSGKGLSRRELFTDARDISTQTDGGELPPAVYKAQLIERGLEELSEYTDLISFEGEIEATRMFVYGKDFFIGDIVQIANEYGHEGKAYISELVISQSEEGISMYPTFKTIQDEEVSDNE